jgi:hypothetical protein
MKITGYSLITIGFIAASLISVTHVLEVNWLYFILTLVVCIIGIAIIRSGQKKDTQSRETLLSNMKIIKESLNNILLNVKKIRDSINPENPQAIHTQIDELLPDYLQSFVESRQTIGHVHGLNVYADVMNFFATGERYLNRVWSASTDGYIDEVTLYMEKSEQQFEAALQIVNGLK